MLGLTSTCRSGFTFFYNSTQRNTVRGVKKMETGGFLGMLIIRSRRLDELK